MENHSEDTKLLTPLELHQKMLGFSNNYFLIDVYRDRQSFYAVPEEELNAGGMWLCLSGIVLNLIMDGELEKAWDYINMLPADTSFIAKLMKYGSMVVHPEITWRQLVDILNELKKLNKPLISVVLTAGRPFLLNGFNDFSRVGVLLPKHRQEFIGYLEWIYPTNLCPHIYNLCLAEYYYQINNLLEAELLVSSSIKKFDIEGERRIIFSSLYMQSKILLANGKTVRTESFIQQMRKLSGEAGNAEFSYNIDAAEVLFALYDGKMAFVNNWLANNAPDEFANFNMLDLYRYMIKMRCYIASKIMLQLFRLQKDYVPFYRRVNALLIYVKLIYLQHYVFLLPERKSLPLKLLNVHLK